MSDSPRLLVTGSREGWDVAALDAALHDHYLRLCALGRGEQIILVHGDAPGVDKQAASLWSSHNLPVEPHEADWSRGKRAGPERNALMVSLGAEQCIAFLTPQSTGTLDCLLKAAAAGIPTQVYGRQK